MTPAGGQCIQHMGNQNKMDRKSKRKKAKWVKKKQTRKQRSSMKQEAR